MSSRNPNIHYLSIGEQVASLRARYPHFSTNFTSPVSLKVQGSLRPTARSLSYTFELKYRLEQSPKVWITTPVLKKNNEGEKIPHTYPEDNLCLYRPKYNEFQKNDLISETVIPWISLWLYFYEVWLITGEWHGGGEHPPLK